MFVRLLISNIPTCQSDQSNVIFMILAVFSVNPNVNGVIEIYHRLTVVAKVTKIRELSHKISYNSACVSYSRESRTKQVVFKGVQFYGVTELCPRLAFVAMVIQDS